MDLENELRPKSPDTEKALQPNDNNVMVWSEYFNNTPSPTKKKTYENLGIAYYEGNRGAVPFSYAICYTVMGSYMVV